MPEERSDPSQARPVHQQLSARDDTSASVEEVVEDVAMVAAVVAESAGTLGGHIEILVNNAAASIQAPLQAGHW